MERIEIEVVYENGTLKLPHDLPLPQGQRVTITIHPPKTAGQRLRGLIQWKGSQEDLDHLILDADNDPLGTGGRMTFDQLPANSALFLDANT